jgi:hypothetical protein
MIRLFNLKSLHELLKGYFIIDFERFEADLFEMLFRDVVTYSFKHIG